MIISTIEELRLYFPAHALDTLDPMAGALDISEHDTLIEKLGYELYNKVVAYYTTIDTDALVQAVQHNDTLGYYDRLLLMSQRIVAYDASARFVGTQVLSVNGAGVNIPTADDYGKVDKDTVETYRRTCISEMHASVNYLLQTLEQWCHDADALTASETAQEDYTDEQTALTEICTLWKKSRFYWNTDTLLIPNAVILQQYLDFYENREKFVQMLPDLNYIQEDVLGDAFNSEFIDWLVSEANAETTDTYEKNVIHRLRKTMARMLEERSQVLKVGTDRKLIAHDEAVRIMQQATEYLTVHQGDFDEEKIQLWKGYVAPPDETDTATTSQPREKAFENHRQGNMFFVAPPLM